MSTAETMEVGFGAAKSLRSLTTAQSLWDHSESLKRNRNIIDRDWKINLAFYKGNQYAWYNPATRSIQSLPTEPGETPRYRVRIVSNQVYAGCHGLLSKMLKTKPKMFATPGSGDEAELKAAQLAESLLEHWWHEFDLDFKLEEAVLWSLIAGQGYWKITWDPHAGDSQKWLLDQQGMPVVNNSQKDKVRGQYEQAGQPPNEQTSYMGDICVEVLSPFNVIVDPSVAIFEDSKFVYCVHNMTPDEVMAKFNAEVSPDVAAVDQDQSIPWDYPNIGQGEKTLKKIVIGYFKPTPTLPEGRYVVFTKDAILVDEPWPYPSSDLPIIKFPGIRVPGSVYDIGVVTHARPLQKELNRTLSQIVEYKNLMIRPQWMAPVGSLRRGMTAEPGVINEYIPVGGLEPKPVEMGALPPYIFEHLKDLSARLKDVFGMTEVSEGRVPPNVEAGIAIDLLQEMSTDRIAPTIKLMEHSLARAGQLMLILAQNYYIEPRMLKIRGSGSSTQVKRFTQAEIQGGIDIRVEAGSGLPRTRAGRQAFVLDLIKSGLVPMERAYKYLDMADIKGFVGPFEADTDKAFREHERLLTGMALNDHAAEEAWGAVEQGFNPETGEPLSGDPRELEDILVKAALTPNISDNHSIHLDTHGMFMKSVEYEGLDSETKRRFELHFKLTLDQIPRPTGENDPKVNLNVRAALGATSISEILKRTGVDVEPEVIGTEIPNETWVTDSRDEPDAEGPSVDKQLEMALLQARIRKELAEAEKAEKEARSPVKQ